MSEGKLFILSGPAGAGKGTVCQEYLKTAQNVFLSISCTTRTPRDGEIDGKHYYFKTKEQFEKEIENNNLLEYVQFCDNYYGTPKDKVLEKLQNGTNVILEIEVQGAMMVKKMYPQAILIFVVAPDMEELKKRLIGRKSETEQSLRKRLEQAEWEMKNNKSYDYIIVNDEIENAVAKLKEIIAAQTKTNLEV